ncbi:MULTISPECIES: hypothetical protein [Paenibacillus]|uniref:hypothetical protein n=1 Tax=Paenibacillus TaxID=44249 RepID=UPI0015BA3E9C|nr:hypothetical protein [Paenibacillus odorifer]
MSNSKLYRFLVEYITENYETTPGQVEATARGIEHYLTDIVIPETLSGNKE